MLSMWYSNPALPFRCEMLPIEPVDRLSMISTSCPAVSRASDRCEPMKPAPPVMSARTSVLLEIADRRRHPRDVLRGEPGMKRQRHELGAGGVGSRALSGKARG